MCNFAPEFRSSKVAQFKRNEWHNMNGISTPIKMEKNYEQRKTDKNNTRTKTIVRQKLLCA